MAIPLANGAVYAAARPFIHDSPPARGTAGASKENPLRFVPFLILIVIVSRAAADDGAVVGRSSPAASLEQLPVIESIPPGSSTSAQTDLLGPTGELLPPYLATRTLSGKAYFEWCLRWNQQQHQLAEQRRIPPRRVSGRVTQRRGFSRSTSSGGYFYGVSRGDFQSESRDTEREWEIGGYGGGPITIYNPFVPPAHK